MAKYIIQKQLTNDVCIVDYTSGKVLRQLNEDAALLLSEHRGGGVFIVDTSGNYFDIWNESVLETQILPAAALSWSGTVYDLYKELEQNFFVNIINPAGSSGGIVETNIIAKGSNYTLTTSDYIIYATADITITLPSSPALGQLYKIYATGNTVTVSANVGQQVQGVGSINIYNNDGIIVQYIKTNQWSLINEHNIINRVNWKFIESLSDLPTPVGGVITTEANKTYVFAPDNGTLDLQGNRIVCGGVNTFVGGSSETSYITSTGLGAGVPLITTEWTLAMQFLSIANVDTALSINGAINPPCALDWTGVNFLNVPNIGLIDTCDNFVYTKGAFLNSKELVFDGSHGTIAFNNSLFSGDGLAGDLIRVTATSTITRRFRIIYSSVVAFGLTQGVNIDPAATVPNEAFILDVVNFSGGGTYLPGVNYTDNKALFQNCVGIPNSGDISQYYMNGNAIVTPVALVNTAYKAEGVTTSAAVTQKFTNTNNRATYIGALTRYFSVTATLSCTSGNNHQIGIYIAKNGIVLPESEVYITTNGAGRAEGAVVQSLVQLTLNDYVEIWVENSTSATDITVTDLNTIII